LAGVSLLQAANGRFAAFTLGTASARFWPVAACDYHRLLKFRSNSADTNCRRQKTTEVV